MSHHHSHHAAAPSSSAGRTVLLGVAVLILLLAAVFGALWIGNSPDATQAEDAARSAERLKNLAELQAADQAQLSTYGWNDRAKGIVHIPITRAMELVLPVLNAKAKPGQPPTQ